MSYMIGTNYDNIYSVENQHFDTLTEAREALKKAVKENLENIPQKSLVPLFKYDKAFYIVCFDRSKKQERQYTFYQLLKVTKSKKQNPISNNVQLSLFNIT